MIDDFAKCVHLVGRERWGRWLLVILLAITVSAVEAVGALLVFTLLGMVSGSDSAPQLPVIGDIQTPAGMGETQLFLWVAGFIALFFILRGCLLLLRGYVEHRVAENAGARLATSLLNGYLSMPYAFHLRRNSATLIRNAHETVQVFVREVLTPFVALVAEGLIVAGMVAVLLVTSPLATVLAAGLFGPLIYGLLRLVHPSLKRLGIISQEQSKVTLQSLQQSLQGVREITILGRQPYFSRGFSRSRLELARARYLRGAMRQVPRVVMETVLVLFIVGFFGLAVVREGSPTGALPVLGLFAYVTFRIKPSLNAIMGGLNSIKYSSAAIDDLYQDSLLARRSLRPGGKAVAPLPFKEAIVLDGVCFRYEETETDALHGIDLTINCGESIGIVGATGGGKSTLVDIILGLLEPSAGAVYVDGCDIKLQTAAWHTNIGTVPQTVFLIDDTLRRNIALGVKDSEIDEEKLRLAIQMAQLEEFLTTLPAGLETVVGERGVRLSGGQRQRVSIARALYVQPRVVVFDEGTSALDNRTEADFMGALREWGHERTIIIIAHRLTTVRECDRVLVVQDGSIADEGTYLDLLSRNDQFKVLAELDGFLSASSAQDDS